MTTFWVDRPRGHNLSYEDLIEELNQRQFRHPVVCTDDPFELFIELLLAVLDEEDLVLLDSDFSSETLSNIGFKEDVTSRTESVSDIQIKDSSELISRVEQASNEWSLGLYTSGTTGVPDRVDQTLEGLTRKVYRDKRFSNHVWAFAYNPSHFAGLQVFFQALMNLNPIIYIFESTVEEIDNAIQEHGITHISATPTFYRLRLQRLEGVYPTVERLTSGGEKFEPNLQESLKERFPDAEFRNVYALTEAGSLLESAGETFQIPQEYNEEMKITEQNELAIHQSLLSDSVTSEVDGEWFYTGDLVEYVDETQFKFVGRESDFVNVGGYRVNPHEVEQLVNTVDGVQAAIVTARESSVTGHILVAEVQPVSNIAPDDVKKRVKEAVNELERWKQPRMINIVEEIDQSRSGKRIR